MVVVVVDVCNEARRLPLPSPQTQREAGLPPDQSRQTHVVDTLASIAQDKVSYSSFRSCLIEKRKSQTEVTVRRHQIRGEGLPGCVGRSMRHCAAAPIRLCPRNVE